MRLNYQNLSSILKNYKVSQNSFISKEFIIPLEQEYATDYKNIVQKDDIVLRQCHLFYIEVQVNSLFHLLL